MRSIKPIALPLLASCVLLICALLQAEDQQTPPDPQALLQQALMANDIDVDGVPPWHLTATFDIYDTKKNHTETISLDETWAGPQQQRREWTSPSLHLTEIVNSTGTFRTGDAEVPVMVEEARKTIVHPLPLEKEIAGSKLILQREPFGKVSLNCVMMAEPIPGLHPDSIFGLFPTYCFALDSPMYRVGFEFGDTIYNTIKVGKFQNRNVAIDDAVMVAHVLRVEGKVTDLHSLASVDLHLFDVPADATESQKGILRISQSLAAGQRIGGPDPIYPQKAKDNHVEGTVILRAIIGRDGRIHSLHILSAKDPDLAVAAIAAVRQWTYRPYKLNGNPTEVDTQITVNFSSN